VKALSSNSSTAKTNKKKNPCIQAGGMAQVVECQICKHEVEFKPQSHQKNKRAGHWWVTPIILATWEAEIGKIGFEASLGK
jgi:hypothetical protein